MAMTNYPYPASFLEPMPAWPVNEAVKPWADIPTAAEWAEAQESAQPTESLAWKAARSALGIVGINLDKKPERKLEAPAAGLTDR